MMKKYRGIYDEFEKPIEGSSLSEIKQKIENAAGYNGHNEFKEYYTAQIDEFNIIGWNCAVHYFSMKDEKWHRYKNKVTMSLSWREAREPFYTIANWLLNVLGYREKEIEKQKKWIQQREIDKLYGR